MSRVLRERECEVDECVKVARGQRLCSMHQARQYRYGSLLPKRQKLTLIDERTRFLKKVSSGWQSDCWPWVGTVLRNGYGQFRYNDGRRTTASRYAYEFWIGPIPSGYEVDHVVARGCTSTACVNPEHLEAVTPAENKRRSGNVGGVNGRKTHCDRGHPFAPENTYIYPSGARACRECRRQWKLGRSAA